MANQPPEDTEPEAAPVEPAAPYSANGKDYYLSPDGAIVNVDAGVNPLEDYPDLTPATEQDYNAAEYARQEVALAADARVDRAPDGYVDPATAFIGPGGAPEPEYSAEQAATQLEPLPETYSANGKDYYLTPEGVLVNVEAGTDYRVDYPNLTPATKQDYDAAAYARQETKAKAEQAAFEATTPERAFEDVEELTPEQVEAQKNAPPETYQRNGRDYYRQPDGQIVSVEAGVDVRPDYPELQPVKAADVPFAREGQNYYVDKKGKVLTLSPEVNASKDYPDLRPASAEDVRKHDLQATRGTRSEQLKTVGESAVATVAELASALDKERAEAAFWGRYIHPSLGDGYAPEDYRRPESFAPEAYTPEALERREANPIATEIGTLIPDVIVEAATAGEAGPILAANRARRAAQAAGALGAGARAAQTGGRFARAARAAGRAAGAVGRGVGRAGEEFIDRLAPGPVTTARQQAAQAARLAANGIIAEAGDAVISGEEFDFTDALGLWAPTQAVFEPVASHMMGNAREWFDLGKRTARNAVDAAVDRASKKRVKVTLGEKDPVKQAGLMRRNADAIFDEQQTKLDDALDVIDQQMVDAPEKLFTRSALKKSVTGDIVPQREAANALATKLFQAANVTGRQAAYNAYDVINEALKKEGADIFLALRQARGMLGDELGSALIKEAADGLDTTLSDNKTWGRAAKHHEELAGIRDAGDAARPNVRDVSARDALAGKLDATRAAATLTGNKRLAKAAQDAADALDVSSKVHGARTMGDTLPDEVADYRKVLDKFPERQGPLTEELHAALEKLDLPESWSPERVERHVIERAAGSVDAKKELDGLLAATTEGIAAMADDTARAKARKALQTVKALVAEVDKVPDAFRRVRDFDAQPKTPAERVGHKVIDAATGKLASGVVSHIGSVATGAAGHALGGGYVGAGGTALAGAAIERYVRPKVDAGAKKLADFLKGKLRAYETKKGRIKKYGRTAFGIGALYGANEMAEEDEDSGAVAAAALGVFGLPLFKVKGAAKGLTLHKALQKLEGYAAEYGIKENYKLRDAAWHLFGGPDGTAVYEAWRVIDRHGLDLDAKGAAQRVAKTLETDGTYRYAQSHINDVLARHPEAAELAAKAEGRTAKAAATREAKAGPTKATARQALGTLGEKLDGPFTDNWAEPIKLRLKSPAPLDYNGFTWELSGYRGEDIPEALTTPEHYRHHWDPELGHVNDYQSPERLAFLDGIKQRQRALAPGLKREIDAALEKIDPADRIGRVTAEDEIIRAKLREALGMRAPKPKRELDIATDATSRYRRAKDGFDSWRQKALEPDELDASREWQSMFYRTINADARVGIESAWREAQQIEKEQLEAGLTPEHLFYEAPAAIQKKAKRARETGALVQSTLNKAIAAGRNVPGRVTRGIAMPPDELEKLLKAKQVAAQGFMSTSIHAKTPKGFAERRAKEFGEVPVMLTIEQRTGVPLGQGEGELTLRPGTKFDVVWAKPVDDSGVATAYLREAEESTITPDDIRKGIAGTIPTEAKIAGGLLAVDELTDDDDSGAVGAGVGLGALGLLFGGKGAARIAMHAANDQFVSAAKALGPAGDWLAQNLDRLAGDSVQRLARMGQTAERGEFETIVDQFVNQTTEGALFRIPKDIAPDVAEIDEAAVQDLINAWTDERLAGYASGAEKLHADQMLDEETVMARKQTSARGSNEGGFYKGADGVDRYVKLYDEPQQAIGEHMANQLYRSVGLDAPESSLFEREAGGLGFASTTMPHHGSQDIKDITRDEARKFVRGFWADVLLANWDAPGMHYDNILWPESAVVSGGPVRVDNGSALKFRAQGAPKPADKLGQLSEIEGFFNPKINRSYAELLKKAGISSPKQLAEYLEPTIAGAREYLDDPGEFADPELLDILRDRLTLLEEYAPTLERQPVKRRPVQLGDIVTRTTWPQELTGNEMAYAHSNIDEPLKSKWRQIDPTKPALANKMIDRIEQEILDNIERRFTDPRKNALLRKYTSDQVAFLRDNTARQVGLPEPPEVPSMGNYHGALPADLGEGIARHIETAAAGMTPELRRAVEEFTGAFSGDIKSVQLGEVDPAGLTDKIAQRFGRVAKDLDAATDALSYPDPTRWGTLYRGLRVPESALNELLTHDTFTPTSTLSSSHSPGTGAKFATHGYGRPVVLRFRKVDAAAPVLDMSSSPSEHEWLIPRGGGYKVTGRYFDPEAKHFVFDLEQIDPASKPDLTKAGALAILLGAGAATDEEETPGAVGAGVGLGLAAILGHGGRRLMRGTAELAEQATKRLADAPAAIADARLQSIRRANDAAWRALTPGQRGTLELYTQTSAPLKRALVEESRGTIGATQKDMLDRFRQALDTLSIDNPTAEAPLMRGVDMTDEQIGELLNSNEIQLQNFASTTYFPAKAGEFAASVPGDRRKFGENVSARGGDEPTRPVVFVFDHADKGSPKFPSKEVLDHPALDSESEVILPPGAVFEPSHVEAMQFPDHHGGPPIDGLRVHVRQVAQEPAPVPRAEMNPEAKRLANSDAFAIVKAADGPVSVADFEKAMPGWDAWSTRNQFRRLAHAGLVKLAGEGDDITVEAVDPKGKAGRYMLSLGLGLGAGAKQLLDEDEDDNADSTQGELEPGLEDEIRGKMAEAQAIRQAREQALDATRQKLGYLATQARAQMELAARSIAQPRGVDVPVESVAGVTSNAGTAEFLGPFTSMRAAYEARRAVIERHQQDPTALVDDLTEQYAELADNAPEMHSQVVAQTFKVAQFIQSKLPPVTGVSMARPEGSPPSQLAMRQFALYYSAATDPASVIQDVQNNRVRREQVDTLRQLWPETYGRLQKNVLEQIAQTRPSVQQRMRLDLLFDFGPALDKAFSPTIQAALAAKRAEQAEADSKAPEAMPQRRSNPSIVATSATGSLALGAARGPGIGVQA